MNNFWGYKRLVISILIVMVAFFLYTKLAGPIPFFVNSIQTTKTDLFSSSGQGKVTEIPDSATVNLGVTAQSSSVADAQNKANLTASKIIDAVKKLGVGDKDIKTTNYSVNPNYNGDSQNISNYTVTQNLEIKVKPIASANKVVDAGTANGANLVGGVSYTFSDDLEKTLENKARTMAVADAKDKAQSLANAAGVKLGRVINVVEQNSSPLPFAAQALDKSSAEPASTNITPGENSVVIDVIIYYETY